MMLVVIQQTIGASAAANTALNHPTKRPRVASNRNKAMKMGPMATNTPTAMVEIARKPAVDMNNMAAAFQRPSAAAAAPPLKT